MDVFRTSDAHWVVDINCRLKVAFKDRTGKFFTDIICLKKSWKRKISIKFSILMFIHYSCIEDWSWVFFVILILCFSLFDSVSEYFILFYFYEEISKSNFCLRNSRLLIISFYHCEIFCEILVTDLRYFARS